MNNKEFNTIDIFGKPIKITDIEEAIKETERNIDFSTTTTINFSHTTKVGVSTATGLEYFTDLLNKIKAIEENECSN